MTADRGDSGERLDLVLRRHLADIGGATRTRLQALIEDGQVSINGATVRRASARAAFGDLIAVTLPSFVVRPPMVAEHAALSLLYEDEHLLALDKPPGIVVHPTHAHAAGTVMNALLGYGHDWPAGSRPSVVGRLDKLTSGLVIVAKSAVMHAALQRAMAASNCAKVYLAIVHGRVEPERGEIALRLSRDPADRRRVVASATIGAPSLTWFERLAFADAAGIGLSAVRCRLGTGRTHQIRVHLAARGWPIAGDPVYGEPRWMGMAKGPLADALAAFPRQALHAWRLSMIHPVTACPLHLEAPIPPDLLSLLAAAGLPAAFGGA